MKPLIAIDYDGTLTENAWPEHGAWKPGAIEAVKALLPHARIVIHTARTSPYDLNGFTERPPEVVRKEINDLRNRLDDAGLREVTIWTGVGKPGAIAFVDDRGIRYNDRPGAWKAIVTRLLIMLKQAPDLFPELKED